MKYRMYNVVFLFLIITGILIILTSYLENSLFNLVAYLFLGQFPLFALTDKLSDIYFSGLLFIAAASLWKWFYIVSKEVKSGNHIFKITPTRTYIAGFIFFIIGILNFTAFTNDKVYFIRTEINNFKNEVSFSEINDVNFQAISSFRAGRKGAPHGRAACKLNYFITVESNSGLNFIDTINKDIPNLVNLLKSKNIKYTVNYEDNTDSLCNQRFIPQINGIFDTQL